MNPDRLTRLHAMLVERPEDTFLHFALAQEHQQRGEYEQAIERYQRVLEIDQKYVGAYYHYGSCLQELDRLQEAVNILTRGIDIATQVGAHKDKAEMQQLKLNIELELD